MDQSLNPYRPPKADIQAAPAAASTPIEIAGKGRRFCTWVVDYITFLVLCMILGVALALAFGPGPLRYFEGGWAYLSGFVLLSSYYLFFEGLWARTPGKLLLGTVVTDLNGRAPEFGSIVKRTLARAAPLEGLTFFGQRGFHDRVSKTLVIRKR